MDNKTKVVRIIHRMGIHSNVKGYKYLLDIVCMCLDDDNLKGMYKEIYPIINKKYDTTTPRIERAIRFSLEMAWEKKGMQFCKAFEHFTKRPTVKEAIFAIVDDIKYMQ